MKELSRWRNWLGSRRLTLLAALVLFLFDNPEARRWRIRVEASGLDADDAAPIRGSVTVAGDICIDADVRIAQAEEGMEQRQLQRQQQQSTPPIPGAG